MLGMSSTLGYIGFMTDEEVQAIVPEYEAALARAPQDRDAKIRRAHAEGHSQAAIARLTGYSRETIRQAIHPDVRAELNARRRKTQPSTGS